MELMYKVARPLRRLNTLQIHQIKFNKNPFAIFAVVSNEGFLRDRETRKGTSVQVQTHGLVSRLSSRGAEGPRDTSGRCGCNNDLSALMSDEHWFIFAAVPC